MNWKLIASCALAATLCSPALSEKKGGPPDSYETLVERAKTGDQTVDFRQMRLAYANSPSYANRPDTSAQRRAMMVELNGKQFDQAIKDAGVVLASNYVDIDAHFVEFIAHRELKETELADFHNFVVKRLLKSITDSGDGQTPETAYQVIEVHEEYVVLHTLGVGLPKSQALLKKNGHSYDEIKYEDPGSKEEKTLYFNVDIPIKHGV